MCVCVGGGGVREGERERERGRERGSRFTSYQWSHRTLCEMYSFESFVGRLPHDGRSLKEMLEKCITAAVPRWFVVQEAQVQPQVHVCVLFCCM